MSAADDLARIVDQPDAWSAALYATELTREHHRQADEIARLEAELARVGGLLKRYADELAAADARCQRSEKQRRALLDAAAGPARPRRMWGWLWTGLLALAGVWLSGGMMS